MLRLYTWQLNIRSYETDAWGMLTASGVLRYFEQVGVAAAEEGGYGAEFHREHGSAWVVRRVTLLMHAPARQSAELEITTWASHFAKVRGGREYKISDASTGQLLYTGITEWVYVNRQTLRPMPIPPSVAADYDVPGAPLQTYDPPHIPHTEQNVSLQSITERTAEWHEVDSIGHVNNANYADWLDDAMWAAVEAAGWRTADLREQGLHLRGEYYSLNYKRAALPGDRLRIVTNIKGVEGRLCAVRQTIADGGGVEVLSAESVYGWRGMAGEPAEPPEGWERT